MPIPRIIHFTVSAKPTASQLKCIDIARKVHPDWEVRVWQDPLDPSEFSLGKHWSSVNSGAQLADLIRLDVVHRYGGFYLDSDFMLHRSLEALRIFPFVIASEDGMRLTNAFFGAEGDSPVLKQLIDSLNSDNVDWSLPPNLTTGPHLFTRELKWRDDVTVVPRETFYPFNHNEKPTSARSWTYATHLWEHSWGSSFKNRGPIRQMASAIKGWLVDLPRKVLTVSRRVAINSRQLWALEQPRSYPATGVICAQTIHGPKILLVAEDCTVTPELAIHGTYEFRDEQFIKRTIRRGDWVVDVGANVGIFSLLGAQAVGPFGRIFSYEPNPLPAGLLRKSLVINWLHDRTQVRQRAIGSEKGELTLRFSREALGGATLAAADNSGTFDTSSTMLHTGPEEVLVEVATLDTDFPVNLPIRLLKIDAEGFEHHVLRGGARLLGNHCIDIVMLECVQEVYGLQWGEFLKEIKKLVEYGYQPYTLTRRSKLKKISYDNILYSSRGRNVIFVSKHANDTIQELA